MGGLTISSPVLLLACTACSLVSHRRRAVLNEQEIVDTLLQGWDVNVTVTSFAMPLRDAITLMQETDVLIGMHGAGMPHHLVTLSALSAWPLLSVSTAACSTT